MPSSELHVYHITHEEGLGCVVVHTYNPSSQEAEQKALHKLDRPGLRSEFRASRHYVGKPCLKQTKAADECNLIF